MHLSGPLTIPGWSSWSAGRLRSPVAAADPPRRETYTHGHAPAVVRQHGQRTAEEAAAFLLPELRPGMRLLDVGCGPGSITRGLAERVAPGLVVGVDLSRETLEAARADAAVRGLDNLRYEEASVYELPFPDASFDVAYAHQVFQHLRERGAALREILRVVRPGGLVAVRDVDWATVAYWPSDPWLDRFVDVHLRTWYRNGGEPRMGRQLRALFNGAGFAEVRITAAVWCYATPSETTEWGDSYADRLLTSPMGERPVEYGLASRADVEAMAAAFRSWARHPDALWSFIHVAALGVKPR
jgi:ubiquinone/menaquinone biosynthesis C-methylase UbiE